GRGMIEDVKKHVFTKEETRPNFITGVISHGVALNSPFNITHTGFAATSLGLLPRDDAKNKFLFTIPQTRRALLTEISQVVCALPKLRDVPGVPERLSIETLEATVDGIIRKTAETTCSMVVDLQRGQKTEIEFINGYCCRRGREVVVPTPINDRLVREILERQGTARLALDYA
ncbi:ketopantoate reductase PanE/ApbA C terminal-domain-containing protein, partial [Fusarium sp. MPI-SDFR-AT-0072]